MANNTLDTRIVICNDTTANWGTSTKVLLKGEIGIELTDGTPKFKFGNGRDTFADLPYVSMTPEEINTAVTNAITAASHSHSNKNILDAINVAFTTTLKTNYDAAYTHSTQAHAPSNAEANVQSDWNISDTTSDAFIKNKPTSLPANGGNSTTVNGHTVQSDVPSGAKFTDTKYTLGASPSATNGDVKMNLVGTDGGTGSSVTVKGAGSVSVTTDASGVMTVTGTDTKYNHPNSGVTAGTYKSVTVNAQGHVTGGSNPTTLAGYGITDAIPSNQKGASNGVATLGSDGRVPTSQLPSYVDDVIEGYLSGGKFYKESAHTTEITGETGKIYIDKVSNKTYRWSGSAYVVISETIALGETASTAYRGDRGKAAYDHSQAAHAPTNAEANQNAFSHVKVGSTTVSSSAKTDTLNIASGSNVTVTPDATNKKITISAKDTTYSPATISAPGLMSSADKSKLDGIAEGANNYSHPTSAGNKHIPAGGSSGQILRWGADGTAVWGTDNNTTYSAGTGLALSGTTFNHKNSVTAGTAQGDASKTLTFGGTFTVPTVSYDAQGHITSKGTTTMTMPATPTTVSGNAGSATKLATARTIGLSGGVTGTATSFNGTANITIPVTEVNAMYVRVNSGDTLILNGGGAS